MLLGRCPLSTGKAGALSGSRAGAAALTFAGIYIHIYKDQDGLSSEAKAKSVGSSQEVSGEDGMRCAPAFYR